MMHVDVAEEDGDDDIEDDVLLLSSSSTSLDRGVGLNLILTFLPLLTISSG